MPARPVRALCTLALLLASAPLSAAEPYYGIGPFATAQRQMARGDPAGAIRTLEGLLLARPDADVAPQARYLLALALLETGDYGRSERLFGELIESYPALAEEHRFRRGQALFRWGNHLDAARALADVDPNGPRGPEAERLRAEAAFRASDFATLRRWLDEVERRDGGLSPELRYRRGVARQHGGDPTGALRDLDEVWQEAPEAPWSGPSLIAVAELRTMQGFLWPEVARRAVLAAERSLRQDGVAASLPLLERRLGRGPETERLRARLAYARGRIAVRRGRLGAAVEAFAEARSLAPADDVGVRARAGLAEGKALERLGRAPAALERMAAVAERFADRPEAEEALVRAAELRLARRDHEGAEADFRRLLYLNPLTPFRNRALWGLGWVQLRQGRSEDARPFFASLTKRSLPASLDAASRYWLARTELNLGRLDAARAGFADVLARHPLSYYAALADDQLAEAPPLAPSAAGSSAAAVESETPPELRRIEELVGMGLRSRAREALDAFERRDAGEDGKRPAATLRALARLHDALGHSLRARQVREIYMREYPSTLSLAEVEAAARRAHPLEFEPEIRSAAAAFGLPPALLFALVRTESGFRPRAVSSMRAYGLAQLILPTAREVARRIGAGTVSPGRLLGDPALNVRLGAAYLRGLLDRFEGSEPLALAAYNAGPANVSRWAEYRVRAVEGQGAARRGVGVAPTADELVEEIPVAETKAYVKAVLARARAYERLYAPPPRALERTGEGEHPLGPAIWTEPAGAPGPAPPGAQALAPGWGWLGGGPRPFAPAGGLDRP